MCALQIKTTFKPHARNGNYCCFILSRRRQNRADGPAFLKEQGECGESASRAEPCESPQPSELEVFFRGGIAVPNSRVAYQTRSPVFRTLSRSSSGYFSFDSEPSSPLITHSTATQTPSPSSQVITHALQRISEARGDAQNHGKDPPPNSPSLLSQCWDCMLILLSPLYAPHACDRNLTTLSFIGFCVVHACFTVYRTLQKLFHA